MNFESASRRSPRRRQDLTVSLSRVPSNSDFKNALPPLSPPLRRKAADSSSRVSSRGSRPPPALDTAAMASILGNSKAVSASRASGLADDELTSDNSRSPQIRGQRDSHDLSLPNRNARDSLVSNMLLSLDQFSMSQMASHAPHSGPRSEDNRLYSLSTTITDGNAARAPNVPTAPRGGDGGRHGDYNSYTSNYDTLDDTSHPSDSISHRHRSKSSSGVQSNLGRINSMRDSAVRHGRQPEAARMMRLRGGMGSKSSSTNSIDNAGYVEVLGSQRWASGPGGRSSSSDPEQVPRTSNSNSPPQTAISSQERQENPQQHQQNPQQPWHIEFSNSFFNDAYDDAAPMPTIPGGPRKLTSVPSMPSIPSHKQPASESPLAPERRHSVRSSRSATVGRQSQIKFNNSLAPPLPALDPGSAPAPNIGYGKPKEVVPLSGAQSLPQHPLRQKPSFFRRVFGGFRDSAADNEPAPALPPTPSNRNLVSSSSIDAAHNTRSQQHSSAGQKQQSTPPSRDSHYPPHSNLQKKPSGFFRRRKKSITEAEALPPLPMPLMLPPQPSQQPPPPPHSSQSHSPDPVILTNMPAARMVSNPDHPSEAGVRIMESGKPTPQAKQNSRFESSPGILSRKFVADDADTTSRTVRGFSPDYEPPPTATIRAVGPETASINQDHYLRTPTRQPPAPPQNPARSGSFLSDDSESEDSPRRVVSKALAEEQADYLAVSSFTADDQRLSPTTQRLSSRRSKTSEQNEIDPRASQLSLSIEEPTSAISSKIATSQPAVDPACSSPLAGKSSGLHTPIKAEGSDSKKDGNGLSDIIDEPNFVIGRPTEDDRQKALNVYEGNEDFIQKEKAAAWMGEAGPVRQRTLQAYMDLYDFRNQSIVNALRDVCSRLILRAETQQVDRILVSFSKRWCTCNPNHGFKSLGKF
ncbi:hypothetical protein SEPCBS57363_000798 [Sporothrix epigloea]|uniref:SEC7 domain-containing protein n=1 Tax=Sporothrix epigloea TaxID=1892477 RepID=A0ABP0D7Q5_9PEZI